MATKPVIAGVDGSEQSLLAVGWAALEARRHSSPLRIVSAPDVMPRMPSRGPGPGIGSIQHAVLDHGHGPVAAVPSGD